MNNIFTYLLWEGLDNKAANQIKGSTMVILLTLGNKIFEKTNYQFNLSISPEMYF